MKISFIGGGNMATALVAGLVGKVPEPGNIHVVDPNPEALNKLHTQYGVSTGPDIGAPVADSSIIVLAVKPQQMREVATQLLPQLTGQPLLLSIAAGIRSTDLSRWLGGYGAIVRAMPNTPALIKKGVTGLVAMADVSEEQKELADEVMRAVGDTLWLDDESRIDAVTAVSGSGPAYVFYFLEAMQQAATEMGLAPEEGKQLALATFMGAARLAAQSDEELDVLRQRVTSKGGTTHAAITSMEAAGVKQAIIDAMKAAQARGRELGEELGKDE